MIVVFASIILDHVAVVPRLPGPGETVIGPSYQVFPGGKGANQALAAARAGAPVKVAGAVGHDAAAEAALALLREDGVDLAGVEQTDLPTGAAFIGVDARGQNQIIVTAGANLRARAAGLGSHVWAKGDILLLQCETPEAECIAVAKVAKTRGARVILNAAPAGPVSADLIDLLDVLIVNEHEAVVFSVSRDWDERDPDLIASRVDRELGIACIATLGPEGCIGWSGGVRRSLPAPEVRVVDTVAAGDAFVGAFAASLHKGLGFSSALQRGIAAGSLACTRPGAQPSLPQAAEIEALVLKMGL
ncbi:MAG: ribokinase [Bosea sp. (in: a-proteobacteria)]